MGETTYSVELAKSSRSKCKKCGVQITKGEVRLVTSSENEDRGFTMSTNYHPGCFKIPRKFAKLSPAEFVDEHVTDATDDNSLLPDRKDEIVGQIEAAMASTSAKKKKETPGVDEDKGLMARLKARYETWKENGSDERPKKKSKKSGGKKEEGDADDEEIVRMLPVYDDLKDKKLPELKDILRWNKQVMTGTRDFLMFKAIDGQMNGRLGVCGLDGGRLKYAEDDGDFKVVCNGQFDEDTRIRIPCDFQAKRGDHKNIPRIQPWHEEEPTEEEKEEMEKELEQAREKAEGGDSTAVSNSVADELLKHAESKFDWKLTSKSGIQEATSELLELIEGKVDLPKSKSGKALVGPIVVANQDKPPKEIVKMVIDKFGFAEAKQEKAAKKEAALEAVCQNPKNAPLLAAIQELATLYFKESNKNAGASYTKVAAAIKNLDIEITADNAMSLSKGKTKVEGVGKSSAEKFREFLQTGTIQKLEEKREAAQAS